mmetsp:Transcript_21908/g.46049  ORF Transcript_21908/g.46049 Transcript_21908/m.46049 type:complete len:289 (-) Transcript_21908:656-1522(-)
MSLPSSISMSPSLRGRICMAVRSQGRCMKRDTMSTALVTPLSLASSSTTSLARVRRPVFASAPVMAEASASGVSASTGTAACATPSASRCALQNRCSPTKGQTREGTPALSVRPVHSVLPECTARAQRGTSHWAGTSRDTTSTLLGSTGPAPESSFTPPVTTPQTRFLWCRRGILADAPRKPSHSDCSTILTPVRRAASSATAARPSSSALPMLPKPTKTGGFPAARKRVTLSGALQPVGVGGTQNPAGCIHRPQSWGLPRMRGEKECSTGKSWWCSSARFRAPSSMR